MDPVKTQHDQIIKYLEEIIAKKSEKEVPDIVKSIKLCYDETVHKAEEVLQTKDNTLSEKIQKTKYLIQCKNEIERVQEIARTLLSSELDMPDDEIREVMLLTHKCLRHKEDYEKSIRDMGIPLTRVPDCPLGGNQQFTFIDILNHRNPDPYFEEGKSWKDYSIKDRARLDQTQTGAEFSKAQKGEWKHERNSIAFASIDKNIEIGMYNPAVIPAEMIQMLKVTQEIPLELGNKENILRLINEEIDSFSRDGGGVESHVHHLNHKQAVMLKNDVRDTLELYLQCYGEDKLSEAFVICRDMARIATYQTFLDRGMLTGSDHGILHCHHNCKSSTEMHDKMEKDDMPPLGELLNKIIHYYHDIGYTVGADDFSVKSDHPYIGAKFIELNKAYFENYFPPIILPAKFKPADPYSIIKNTILNHADVYLNSDPTDLEKMIKFSVTVSDACAVSMDNKTQAIWREHPETILELMRLCKFITLFPDYGGFKKLGDAKLTTEPWEVFPLHDRLLQEREDEDSIAYAERIRDLMKDKKNFKNELDFFTFTIYSSVKANLLKIFSDEMNKKRISSAEYAFFSQAVTNSLNSIGAGIVIGQYGAQVQSVSCEKQADDHSIEKPKYIPVIEMAKGLQFALIEATISRDQAAKNSVKLAEEFDGKPEELKAAMERTTEEKDGLLETNAAKVIIKQVTRDTTGVERSLYELKDRWQSNATYKAINHIETELRKAAAKKAYDPELITKSIVEITLLNAGKRRVDEAIQKLTELLNSGKFDTANKVIESLNFATLTKEDQLFLGIST